MVLLKNNLKNSAKCVFCKPKSDDDDIYLKRPGNDLSRLCILKTHPNMLLNPTDNRDNM